MLIEWLLMVTVRLQSCCEELKLKTAEVDRLQETIVDLQSQLSNQNEFLRFVYCLWQCSLKHALKLYCAQTWGFYWVLANKSELSAVKFGGMHRLWRMWHPWVTLLLGCSAVGLSFVQCSMSSSIYNGVCTIFMLTALSGKGLWPW